MKLSKHIFYTVSQKKDRNLDFRFGYKGIVINRREHFFNNYQVDENKTICMNVENHNVKIHIVSKSDFKRGVFDLDSAPKVDALISNIPNSYLMLLTADCLPISVYDSKNCIMALIHASRKTTQLRITEKVIKRMIKKFYVTPKDLVICFGPSIQKESYIMDLSRENRRQLLDIGCKEINIVENNINTYKSLKYFSHRRSEDKQEPEGRFATIVGLSK